MKSEEQATATNARFKIDIYHSSLFCIGLYYLAPRGGLFCADQWRLIECFEDRDKARALYERIKDLPEYLA